MPRPIRWTPLFTTVLVLAGCATSATPTPAQEPAIDAAPEQRTIRVVGIGEVQVDPDQARIDLAVETFAATAREAADQNAQLMEQVIAALVAAGVPREDVDTRDYSVYPEYEQPEPPRPMAEAEPRIRGYRVNNTVSVTTSALDQVGILIDTALEAGANRVNTVTFSLEESDEAEAEATRRAVEKARQSAQAIAEALGVGLGPVLDAATTMEMHPPIPMMAARGMAAEAMDAAQTPIQPGEQTVTARVVVMYAIEGGR